MRRTRILVVLRHRKFSLTRSCKIWFLIIYRLILPVLAAKWITDYRRMALSISRATFASRAALRTLLGKHGAALQIQVAGMKATYGEKYPYSKPFPYEKRKYTIFDEIFEDTRRRFNENSKVIVVEGNIGVGKNEFAKQLAHNFDLKYVPGVTEDDIFVTGEGFDVRSVDFAITEEAQEYTNQKLFNDKNPERGKSLRLQYQFYCQRYIQYYSKALLHVLSTGNYCASVSHCPLRQLTCMRLVYFHVL